MQYLKSVALASSLTMLSACGAIFSSSTATINVNSEPQGAEVVVNGNPMGRTPLQTQVSNRETQTIQLRFQDGKVSTCVLPAKLGAGYVVLDVLFTGLIGVIVDAVTNGWTELSQTSCFIQASQADLTPTLPAEGPVSDSATP